MSSPDPGPEVFVRACIEHRVPLGGPDGLTCPRPHWALDGRTDEIASWFVVYVPYGRVAGKVIGAANSAQVSRVEWAPWFEQTFEAIQREALAGRTGEGFTEAAERERLKPRASGGLRATGEFKGMGRGANMRRSA